MTDTEAAEFGRCIAALLAAGYALHMGAKSLHVGSHKSWGLDPAEAARRAAIELGVQW